MTYLTFQEFHAMQELLENYGKGIILWDTGNTHEDGGEYILMSEDEKEIYKFREKLQELVETKRTATQEADSSALKGLLYRFGIRYVK